MNLLAIPLDKQAHMWSGMAVCYTVALLARLALPEHAANLVGLCAAVLAGALKEWAWDRLHPTTNTVDVYDFWATALGGTAAAAVLYFVF
jgi:hypothetical protein